MPNTLPTYGGDLNVSKFISFGRSIGESPLTPTQVAALNRFVKNLKDVGIWGRFQAIYPFVGGTSGWHSLNLVNPALFRMTQNGTVINNSNGTQGNGVNGFWDTNYDPGNQANGGFYSLYSRTNLASNDKFDIGFDSSAFQIIALDDGGLNANGVYNGSSVTVETDDSLGFYTLGCDIFGNTSISKNGHFGAQDFIGLPMGFSGFNMYFMANNTIDSGANHFSDRQYAFLAMGNNFSFLGDVLLNIAVQNLQAALGRQV